MTESFVRLDPGSTSQELIALVRRFRMRARHASVPGRLRLREVAPSLASLGLLPVLQEARKTVNERLRLLGVMPPSFDAPPADVFMDLAGDRAILLRLRTSATREQRNTTVDAIVLSSSDAGPLVADLARVIPADWSDNSFVEARLIDRLKERFGDLSPNGKLLADPIVRTARRLYADQLRDALRPIISAIGDAPAQREALEQLEPFKKDPSALVAILRDPDISVPHYTIFCANCDTPHLTFTDRAGADRAVSDSGRRCGLCREQELGLLDTFAVREEYARSLAQGLWLESLATDVAAYRTIEVWTGQMVGPHEVDVLTVLGDRVVLIESKDTSFGQNDLSVTAFKAQDVGAQVVVILTTRDVHENVIETINKLSRQGVERREYRMISSPSADVIRTQLLDVLDELDARKLQTWLTPSGPAERYLSALGSGTFIIEDEGQS